MDRNFIIHLWDILAGKTLEDNILLENKYSKRLPNLNNGITGSIYIQHWDASTVMLEMWPFSCSMNLDCDVCWKTEEIEVKTESRQTKRMKWIDASLLKEDDYLITDTSRINIEEVVTEDILLQLWPRIICKNCQINNQNKWDDTTEKTQWNSVIRK